VGKIARLFFWQFCQLRSEKKTLTKLHCCDLAPCKWHLHSSQPDPLLKLYVLSAHVSQIRPITFGRQLHCPVMFWQPVSTEPSVLHWHTENWIITKILQVGLEFLKFEFIIWNSIYIEVDFPVSKESSSKMRNSKDYFRRLWFNSRKIQIHERLKICPFSWRERHALTQGACLGLCYTNLATQIGALNVLDFQNNSSPKKLNILNKHLLFPSGKIAEKRSLYECILTIWHCIFSAGIPSVPTGLLSIYLKG